jgi:hypothetical protein
MSAFILIAALAMQAASATLQIVVVADGRHVDGAQIVANGKTVQTGRDGRASINVITGPVEVTASS